MYSWIILSCCWVYFAHLVASAAKTRGHKYSSWFALALVVSPVLAFLFLVITVPKKKGTAPKRSYFDRKVMGEFSTMNQVGLMSDSELQNVQRNLTGKDYSDA